MFSVKLSLVPEDGSLKESGISLRLDALGLKEPFAGEALLVDYDLSRIYEKILGKIRAQGSLGLECSRCLRNFERKVDREFLAEFEPQPEEANPRGGPDPEDPELNVVFFEGGLLPLGEEIRQEMELEIPLAPLCTPDCKGLCEVCGINKNLHRCGCEPKRRDNPFSGLKKLFNQSKEN